LHKVTEDDVVRACSGTTAQCEDPFNCASEILLVLLSHFALYRSLTTDAR